MKQSRYPLDSRFRWALGVFGTIFIPMLVYVPFADLARTGKINPAQFLWPGLGIPFFAFCWRFTRIYVEVTDDALLICGFFTERIPLKKIRAITVPGRFDRVENTRYISSYERSWGKGWVQSSDSRILLLDCGRDQIAIEFPDPAPIYYDLQRRLDALRR